MISYPLSFHGSASASAGLSTNWETQATNERLICAVPKEFEGEGNGASPEDLYLLALQNCFVASFKVYAHYSKLQFDTIEVKSELVVDLNEQKKPCMKTITFKISISGASDQKRAELLVKKTLDNGFILNSVKTTIAHELTFQH
jgi:organic hydroperoxide reductase OsmC/OhrA